MRRSVLFFIVIGVVARRAARNRRLILELLSKFLAQGIVLIEIRGAAYQRILQTARTALAIGTWTARRRLFLHIIQFACPGINSGRTRGPGIGPRGPAALSLLIARA